MTPNKYKETSKYISLILRHQPEVIGITLDEHGWANDKTGCALKRSLYCT